MKILYLNAWHATVQAPLADFLTHHVADTDVFCFQEAEAPFSELAHAILQDFIEVTAHKFVTESDDFYLATYVRKSLTVKSSGTLFGGEAQVGLGVYVQLDLGTGQLLVCNLHGMSRPVDKSDTPGRWRQTEGLVDFCRTKGIPSVIGGDFNVFRRNASLQVLREAGYRDLIQEYRITNTRNHFVWDRYPQNPRQYYSDYAFVDPAITVHSFTAPDVAVSDHLPLLLEVSMSHPSLHTVTLQPKPVKGSAESHERIPSQTQLTSHQSLDQLVK